MSLSDPIMAALVRAAEERDIPWMRLGESLVQLGHGKHQRRIEGTLTGERHLTREGEDAGCRYRILVEGAPRDVADAVIDMLFPPEAAARIPVVAIAGTHGKTTTAGMVGRILEQAGHTVGLATSDGITIGGVPAVQGDQTGPDAGRLVLCDPRVDAAVLETACGGILRSGLGWRQCDVGAVLNVASGHLGPEGVVTLDERAAAERLVVEVAREACVLNADDRRVAAMAGHSPAEPIYVTTNRGNALVRSHIRSGKRAVVLEEGLNGPLLVLYRGEEQVALLWACQIPSALDGLAGHNVRNALFAAAVACGLGIGVEAIREGLKSFKKETRPTPGAELPALPRAAPARSPSYSARARARP